MSASVDVSDNAQAVTPVTGQIYRVQNVAYADHVLASYGANATDGNPIVSLPCTSASMDKQLVCTLTHL